MSERIRFTQLSDFCGAGVPIPEGWLSITDCDVLIVVGLTGVGKTTVLTLLLSQLGDESSDERYTGADGPNSLPVLLPNRREITDILMIPLVQQHDGLAMEPVADRSMRFELTRRYRALHPGGMANALSQLAISPDAASGLVLFDGLRGENEIRHASELLPRARFLMLDAPDAVRIERLAARRDAFDVVSARAAVDRLEQVTSFADLGIPQLSEIMTANEERRLLELVERGTVESEELIAKAEIVLAERRNYDPAATREALQSYAHERSLVVDTATSAPAEIAARIVDWLRGTERSTDIKSAP